ncbi:MAG: glycoside hydrolase family 3 C-terminal domain-containing protein, partial [Luteolibacter sp.]
SIHTLAVLGPTADRMSALLGNYAGTPKAPVTLIEGIRRKLTPLGVKILHEPAVPLVAGFNDDSDPLRPGETFTDATLTTQGLRGEVFSNINLEGKACTEFTDTLLDHRWTAFEPHPIFPATPTSVRWTGVLMPPIDGEYTLAFDLLGGVRIFVNDKLKFDQWDKLVNGVEHIKIKLTGGKPASLRIELRQLHAWGKFIAGWKRQDHAQRMERALAAAREADHILLTLGLTPDLEGEEMKVNAEGFVGGDRSTLHLPACQQELLEKVTALGKPVTVVLTGGSAVTFDTGKANAILHAWYYGQRGGDAVAAALLGEFSPGGRLPITFYQSDADLPPFEDYAMATPPGRTYRYFTGKPLFPFGHGLSYATFRYGAPSVTPAIAKPDGTITVALEITNTGGMSADEVVQIYATRKAPLAGDPLRRLVGFQRITLAAGETRKVSIPIPVETLRNWDETLSAYGVTPGIWELHSGSSSADLRGLTNLTIQP